MTTRSPIATSNLVKDDGVGAWSTSCAAQVRAIVQKAINQRMRIIREGDTCIPADMVRAPIARLQAWLSTTNQYMSRASLHRFAETYGNDLRLVMPSTAGGASLLHQFDTLITMKNTDITDRLNRAAHDFTMWDRPAQGEYLLKVGIYTIRVKSIGDHYHWVVSNADGTVRSGIANSSALSAKQLGISAALADINERIEAI